MSDELQQQVKDFHKRFGRDFKKAIASLELLDGFGPRKLEAHIRSPVLQEDTKYATILRNFVEQIDAKTPQPIQCKITALSGDEQCHRYVYRSADDFILFLERIRPRIEENLEPLDSRKTTCYHTIVTGFDALYTKILPAFKESDYLRTLDNQLREHCNPELFSQAPGEDLPASKKQVKKWTNQREKWSIRSDVPYPDGVVR